jgi:hypothetical protein
MVLPAKVSLRRPPGKPDGRDWVAIVRVERPLQEQRLPIDGAEQWLSNG